MNGKSQFSCSTYVAYVYKHPYRSSFFQMLDKIPVCIGCSYFQWCCVDNFGIRCHRCLHHCYKGLNGHCNDMLLTQTHGTINEISTIFPKTNRLRFNPWDDDCLLTFAFEWLVFCAWCPFILCKSRLALITANAFGVVFAMVSKLVPFTIEMTIRLAISHYFDIFHRIKILKINHSSLIQRTVKLSMAMSSNALTVSVMFGFFNNGKYLRSIFKP